MNDATLRRPFVSSVSETSKTAVCACSTMIAGSASPFRTAVWISYVACSRRRIFDMPPTIWACRGSAATSVTAEVSWSTASRPPASSSVPVRRSCSTTVIASTGWFSA
ncbi:unannotated protein [freshwater metagenome]|uniref:Unannotated protein n=1 Tax=freshwater metagenome TaxID=449393 RepID=A0A6J7JHU4_9ZZZZ